MDKMKKLVFIIVSVILCGCNQNKEQTNAEGPVSEEASHTVPEVTTVKVQPRTFQHEILANGSVVCTKYVDEYFTGNEVIIDMRIVNGQHVCCGDTIAVLDGYQAGMEVSTAAIGLDMAELELKDALVGQGFDPNDPASVPTEVLSLLELRSGVKSARLQLAKAMKGLDRTYVIAPFDGIIANLNQLQGNKANTATPFCRVLSTDNMAVDFKLIETELSLVRVGDAVEIFRPEGSSLKAIVSEINPIIDQNGQINVRAHIASPDGLKDGQSLKISVKRDLERAIVVPKGAVVMRDHRPVVFTFAADSTAQWNYVEVLYENLSEYALDGLTEGMEVIVEGNKNLSHGTRIRKHE